MAKRITIHLTEDNVKEIIAKEICSQGGFKVSADDVTLRVGQSVVDMEWQSMMSLFSRDAMWK